MTGIISDEDYLRIARQKVEAAEYLINGVETKDGMYLAGYITECALKALIMNKTPAVERVAMFLRISKGYRMHDAETLADILKTDLGIRVPPSLMRKHIRMGWNTGIRYSPGRPNPGEARGVLKAGKQTLAWVEGNMT